MKAYCSLSILIAFVFSTGIIQAQNKSKKNVVEITKNDFARIQDFHASNASIFGIELEMTIEEVLKIIQKNRKILAEKDFHNSSRYYVYERIKDEKGACLFYLIWDPGDSRLKEITIFKAMESYLKGLSQELLKLRVLAPWSEVTNYFLGLPDREEVILNIPSINLIDKGYFYSDRGIVIMHHKDQNGESVRFSFILMKGGNTNQK